MRGNIRAAVNILRKGKSHGDKIKLDEVTNIDDLITVSNILRLEGIMNINVEHAIKAMRTNNKPTAINFIWGPSPNGDGRGLIRELEELAKLRGE